MKTNTAKKIMGSSGLPALFIIALVAFFNLQCLNDPQEVNTYYLIKMPLSACQIQNAENFSYYNGIDVCKNNNDFKAELQKKLRVHKTIFYTNNTDVIPADFNINSYSQPVPLRFDVWDSIWALGYKKIQPMITSGNSRCSGGEVYDWYSGECRIMPSGITSITITPPYLFQSSGGDQNDINREHAWPSSWFASATEVNNASAGSYCYNGNDDSSYLTYRDYRAFADLHHLLPTKGSINTIRSDNPFGVVNANDGGFPTANGNKFGAPRTDGIMTDVNDFVAVPKVFEPADEMKGDIARIYFYMATRYYTEDTCWPSDKPATDKATIRPWQENVLRYWHSIDPVSDDERARNDLIYRIQGNRNPFVDHPDWVDKIADF